jgi:hypothetical protein
MTELIVWLMYLTTVGLAVFIGYRAGHVKGEDEGVRQGYAEGRKDGAFWAVVRND